MEFTWQEKDVVAGRKIATANGSEFFLIGYIPGGDDTKKQYTVISLSDGMVIPEVKTKAELAAHLNDNKYFPLTLIHSREIQERLAAIP